MDAPYSDPDKREETITGMSDPGPLIKPLEATEDVSMGNQEESTGILSKIIYAMKEVQRLSRIGKNKLTPNGKAYYFRSLR